MEKRMQTCEKCRQQFSVKLTRCPVCGYEPDNRFDAFSGTLVAVDQTFAEPTRKFNKLVGKILDQKTKKSYAIEDGTTIGRDQATITIRDTRMSRQHTVIKQIEGELVIVDLGSANHTYLNGRMVNEPTVIKKDDEIQVGNSELVVLEIEELLHEK